MRPILTGWILACAAILGACADEPAESPPAVAEVEPSAQAGDRLPDAVLGIYDTDAEACARQTTMARLVVSPDTLDFYYGHATVDAVEVRDGGYDVDATLYQTEGAVEVIPEPTMYRLVPSGDGLRLESDYGGASTLVRCAAGGASGGDRSAAASADGSVRSEYTEIAGCATFETYSESGGGVQRCPGVQGTPLFVTEGAPGCLVDYVPADAAPDQNTAARRLADREAGSFACAAS